MKTNILVTYASKYGATKEIAEKIGEVLCQAGLQVQVASVEEIRDLTPYSAVVLGSALYIGKWYKQGMDFIKSYEKVLASKPVWIFSSGPSGEGDPVKLVDGKSLPADVKAIVDRIHPRDITLFHGDINLDKINAMEKFAVKNVVKKPFGDYRDWDMIVAWATKVAGALKN